MAKNQKRPKAGIFIQKKAAILGGHLKGHNVMSRPGDGEEEGDAGEPVAAKDISLTGVILTQKQFDFFCGEDSYRRHFDVGAKPHQWLESYFRIPMKTTYIGCSAMLEYGVSAKTLELTDAVRLKTKYINVDRDSGTVTLDLQLIAPFPRKLETLDLENFYDKQITVSLKFGEVEDGQAASEQSQLELGQEAEEGGEDKSSSGRKQNGDRPAAH